METYILTVLSLAGIYAILAISYDPVSGYAGLFSIAHGADFGIGADAGALTMPKFGVPGQKGFSASAAYAPGRVTKNMKRGGSTC